MPAVDWATSAAKVILLDDIKEGILPSDYSPEDAWHEVYSNLVEFHGVEYEQFRRNLKSYRKSHQKMVDQVGWAKEAIAHDLKIHPRALFDHRGEWKFAFSLAKKLLEKDVARRKHEKMKPKKLRKTRREYELFPLDIFRQRIYQQVRRQKFENYLEKKRQEKEEDRKAYLANNNVKS